MRNSIRQQLLQSDSRSTSLTLDPSIVHYKSRVTNIVDYISRALQRVCYSEDISYDTLVDCMREIHGVDFLQDTYRHQSSLCHVVLRDFYELVRQRYYAGLTSSGSSQ
ncbi:hypothetical protein TNCV_4459641 [Trichonephila clavipes]|nr:hypothetical protein TNCV_4459641 [Trichonephila clavipes]